MAESQSSPTMEASIYDPLPTNMDCIRLLYLKLNWASTKRIAMTREGKLDEQFSKVHMKDIIGRLEIVTFAKRPKYEALSYEWGKDLPSRQMSINGCGVKIRANLSRALAVLLSENFREERVLWIDALCINQADLDERSRQVRLMPFIYTRAQKVLSWLGNPGTLDLGGASSDSESRALAREGWAAAALVLGQDSYWERMWITQEIVLARDVEVYFKPLYHLDRESRSFGAVEYSSDLLKRGRVSRTSFTWSEFREHVQGFPELRAAQLIEERKNRFGDSHLLINLLRNHRQALCQDPRDKIYGLIGIAIDVDVDFPMTYGTPLTEVYADMLDYQNRKCAKDQKYQGHKDMLEFCQLVGEALKLDGETMPQQISQIPTPPAGLAGSGPPLLRVTLGLAGYVQCIGPSLEDLISLQSATTKWRTALREALTLDAVGRREALEQNECFLEKLEELDHANQDVVFSFEQKPLWSGNRHWNRRVTVPKSDARVLEEPNRTSTSTHPRLFLLKPNGWHGERSKDIASQGLSPGFIGLAPPDTQDGDIIYYISGSQRVVVVRDLGVVVGEPTREREDPVRDYAFIGCAAMSKNHSTILEDKAKRHQRAWEETTPLDAFSVAPDKWLSLWDIDMPIELAHQLSATCRACAGW